MIEIILYNFLKERLTTKVYSEKKGRMPEEFVFFERISGSERNHINRCSFAIQSYSSSLLGAVQLNEKVKKAMKQFIELPTIASCDLETNYNFTDTTTKKHRYQAIFNIIYYEN